MPNKDKTISSNLNLFPDPSLIEYFNRVRRDSERIAEPLEIEDYGIQTMPEVSPPKWHLAHTAWFFETLLLKPYLKGYKEYHPLRATAHFVLILTKYKFRAKIITPTSLL